METSEHAVLYIYTVYLQIYNLYIILLIILFLSLLTYCFKRKVKPEIHMSHLPLCRTVCWD